MRSGEVGDERVPGVWLEFELGKLCLLGRKAWFLDSYLPVVFCVQSEFFFNTNLTAFKALMCVRLK